MSTRSMTVYLWHTTCVCIAYYLIGQPRSLAGAAVLMVVFTILLVGVVGAMRPLEGRGTGSRVPRPLGYACVVGVVAMLTTQPTLFPKGGDEIKLPVPSGRPTVEVVRPGTAGQAAPIAAAGGATTDAAAGDAPADAPAWLAEHGVDGALAVVVDADGLDVHEVGQVDDIGADDPFQVFSVTKTMVAAVALQLVGEGRLTLDGPLPAIDGLPRSATSQLSLRRLLSHSSGLADYRDAPGFVGDERLAPVDAVRLSIEAGDLSVTKVRYAASNYFLVGLVIEEVARAPLDTVLEQRLFAPLGLEDTRLINNSRLGFVGQASAGVVSTPRDLARWYDALMRRQVVLPPALLAEMLDGGPTTSVGLGAWKRCPCGRATAEIPTPWTYVFHDGSDVRVLYIPHRDEVMALRLSSPLYGAERVSDELDALVFALS
jgi:CubicO group peptidase (beta-lactamase class C family)